MREMFHRIILIYMLVFSSMFISCLITGRVVNYSQDPADNNFQNENYLFSHRLNYVIQLTVLFTIFTMLFLIGLLLVFLISMYIYLNVMAKSDEEITFKIALDLFKRIFVKGIFYEGESETSAIHYYIALIAIFIGTSIFFMIYFAIKQSFIHNIQYDNYSDNPEDNPELTQPQKFLILLSIIFNAIIIFAMLIISYSDYFNNKINWAIAFVVTLFLLITSNYTLVFYLQQNHKKYMLMYWLGFVLPIILFLLFYYFINKNS